MGEDQDKDIEEEEEKDEGDFRVEPSRLCSMWIFIAKSAKGK